MFYTVLAIAPKSSKHTHKSNRYAGIYFRTGGAELIALASSLCLHVCVHLILVSLKGKLIPNAVRSCSLFLITYWS